MPRPKNERIVQTPPIFTEFKPLGISARLLNKTSLSLDEYEAFRLADNVGLSHAEAAEEMEISRSTFSRLIEQARKKVANLIINGSLLQIEGGNVHFRKNIIKCLSCGYMFDMNIDSSFTECPECRSANLLNLAGGFGHGICCTDRNFNHFNKKKGGKYARR
ncbi:MAG: DUF134 domain-containing protein [Bacteroidales bacterium]|nr:DUF134 domain-containing protein [Bacteroidales bacterium]